MYLLIFQIKFTDLGIECGVANNWDRIGFYFPHGSNGIGLHDCNSCDCEVFISKNPPDNLSPDDIVEFEWNGQFKYSFGVKAYFAIYGNV